MSATLENGRPEAAGEAAVRRRFATRATRGGSVAPDAPAAVAAVPGALVTPRREAIRWPATNARSPSPVAPVGAAAILLSKLRVAAPILLTGVASAAQREAGDRVVHALGGQVDAAIHRCLRAIGAAAAGLPPAQRALVQDLALGLRPDRARIVESVASALAPIDAIAMLATTGLAMCAGDMPCLGWASETMGRRSRQASEACLDAIHGGVTDAAAAAIARIATSMLLDALLAHPGITEATRIALRAGPAATA